MGAPIMAAGSSATNGLWGSVIGGLSEGIQKIGGEILPAWTAKQLGGVEPAGKISSPVNTSLGDILGLNKSSGQENFMDNVTENKAPIKPNTVIAAGVVLVGLIVILKVL